MKDVRDIGTVKVLQFIILVMLDMVMIPAVYVPIALKMERLSIIAVVNISFDWAVMVLLLLMFQNCCRGRALKTTGEFMCLLFIQYLCLFFEIGSWTVDGFPGLRGVNYFCNITSNSLLMCTLFFFFRYLCKAVLGVDKLRSVWGRVVSLTACLGIILELVNIRFGFFYTVSQDNIYKRAALGSIMGFVPYMVILSVCTVLLFRQPISWGKKLSYMSFVFPAVIVTIWYSVTGLPPTFYVATSVGIILIYGNTYINMSQDVAYYSVENAKKEAELALERNRLMLTQIKPHFLYNSLGNIEILCKLDPDKAGRAIHHFAVYLRNNMDIVTADKVIPVSQELEHIRNYIWLEHMRFDDDLTFREEIETDQFVVPPLSIQPLVENAVKHGMMGKEDGRISVLLSIKEMEDVYEIQVIDDGCGFDPDQMPEDGRSHIGILNARKSLEFRVGGRMEIESKLGQGTKITIQIPKDQKGVRDEYTGG